MKQILSKEQLNTLSEGTVLAFFYYGEYFLGRVSKEIYDVDDTDEYDYIYGEDGFDRVGNKWVRTDVDFYNLEEGDGLTIEFGEPNDWGETTDLMWELDDREVRAFKKIAGGGTSFAKLNGQYMSIRNINPIHVKEIIEVDDKMESPRGPVYIDHMIRFHNGALVAYSDAERQGFVWVVEGAN